MKANSIIGESAGADRLGCATSLTSRLKSITMPVVVRNCIGLVLYVLAGVLINIEAAAITCSAGSYSVGESASITCNFRTDISDGRRSFIIKHHSSQDDKLGEDVTVCHWLTQDYQCHVSDGYTFNENITDHVTVGIPSVTNSHAGLYTCSFVPLQDGEETHACDLSVKDAATNTKRGKSAVPESELDGVDPPGRSPSEGDDNETDDLVIAIPIVGVLAICAGVAVVWFLRRRRQKRNRGGIESGDKQALLLEERKTIKSRLAGFKLPKKPQALMNIIQREIDSGLDRAEQSATQTEADMAMENKADLKMYPVCLPPLAESDVGGFLVVEIRSKIVRIFDVNLRKSGVFKIGPAIYPVKPETRTGNQLFEFIVDSIDKFVRDRIPKAERRDAVLILPYPCQQTSLEEAKLVRWTQEFSCQGVENQGLHGLLQKAVDGKQIGKNPCRVKFVAIVNDVVSTVVSVAQQNPDCRIGLVVGSGLNACYVESWGDVKGNGGQEQGSVKLYDTEVGALGENDCLEQFGTDYDRKLDSSSGAPGTQILEKMVSWTYLNEIVRLILEDLRKEDLLLVSVPLECSVFQNGVLTADHVAAIDSDTYHSESKKTSAAKETSGIEENTSADGNNDPQKTQSTTERILRELGADEFTEEDLNTVRDVCRLVIDRAAHLTGAVLASLVNRVNQPGVVIVVDGELNRKLPRFNGLLYTSANQLVRSQLKGKFYLVSSFGGGDVGAARIAAAAKRQSSQAASTSQSQ